MAKFIVMTIWENYQINYFFKEIKSGDRSQQGYLIASAYLLREGDKRMSIARINMMEFLTEKDLESSENFYQTIQKEWFGNAQTVITVRTGQKSILNLAVYSSYEDAETNLPKRKEFQDILKNKFTVVDSFYYEGDITYFENSKADMIKVVWKS